METSLEKRQTIEVQKQGKYAELVQKCRRNTFHTILTTVKVGSRGFIHILSFSQLYEVMEASPRSKAQLERKVI